MGIEVVDFFQDSKTTLVRVGIIDTDSSVVFEGAGVANRHPDDKFDTDIGFAIALSRALVKLSKEIDKSVNFEVGKRDNWRKQAERKDAIEYNASLADELVNILLKSFMQDTWSEYANVSTV